MAKPRKPPGSESAGTPSQQDESDIVEEVGAVPANDGSGDLLADEAKVREAGAVDAESIRENRRIEEIVNKKRSGQSDVQFNSDDILEKYEGVIKYWPANTIDILVKRVTGTPVEWVIQSRPRTGADLYAAILLRHGRDAEATYDVRLRDCSSAQRRGTGRITMPDTRDTPPALQPTQGQPMQSPYGQPPPAPAQPPTTDPVVMMSKMFDMFQQMQTSMRPATAAPPIPAPAPAPFLGQSTDPMAMMSTMFGMFQKMQQTAQAPAPQPQPSQPSTDPMAVMQESFRLFQQVQPQPSQAAPAMPPPPPQGSDPSVMMAWMQQMLGIFQKMQQQPVPQPQVQQLMQPQIDPMAMMGKMFDMFMKLQQSTQPPPQQQPGQYRDPNGQYGPARGPYTGPRPYSGPQGYPQSQQGYPQQQQGYSQQQPPSQRPKTAAEEFRDAIGIVETAVSIAERFRPQAPAAEPDDRDRDEDNPVKIMDVGDLKLVVDRNDGSARKWETGVANMGTVLKWLAEQREAVMKAASEREAKQQQQTRKQPLPAGYVEVTPGYQAPPGYVAVPVGMGQGLPPPPDESEMPPPISQQEEQPPRPQRTWGAPPMPGDSGG